MKFALKWERAPVLWMASLSLVAFAAGAAASSSAPHVHTAMLSAFCSQFQREMDQGMARMMEDMHASGYTNDVDVDFLAMMIPHHQGAVDMARLELQHGKEPGTRQLEGEIIAGQAVEIESMTRRLATLKQTGGAGEEFPALGGTRGP